MSKEVRTFVTIKATHADKKMTTKLFIREHLMM